MKVILLLFVFISFLHSQDLDSLLEDYKQESELSHKTKDESAGNLILYTRDDLERMQVESLKDILKSLRHFPYLENRLAQADNLNADPLAYSSKSIRIYLNENELLTAITGSGLILFGNIEMDFIDHVEIYEGFPSMENGAEPATFVIRLYSKTAEHDEGGRIKTVLGSYGTNKENVYYANKENGLSYFVYANHLADNQPIYEHDGETLKRNTETNRFYGSLSSENHTVELHAMQVNGDAFLGSLVGNVPKNTEKEAQFLNIALHSKFLNDTLTVNISYINEDNNIAYKYDPSKPIVIPGTPPLIVTSLVQNLEEESLTASVTKKWRLDNHELSVGLHYRYKHFDLTDVTFNIAPLTQAYYREDVYSVFVQDLLSLDENNLITLSVMNKYYDRKGSVKNINTTQLRVGYIYTNEKWVAKTFLSHLEFSPEPYMTISPQYGNEKLEKETYQSIFQEFSYRTPSTLSKIVLGYGKTENFPILDQAFKVKNSDLKIIGKSAALEFTLFFSKKDKLELQTNYTFVESPYGGEALEHYSYIARMLNSVSKFDVFNELVVHSGYSDVPTGYDYTAGVKYAFSKDLHVSIKGDNIFNSGLKRSYVNQIDFATQAVTDSVTVPVIERRFMFGLEYLF